MPNHRTDMISEEVKREVDRIIRETLSDPRICGTYCITRAEVTRDLRYGKIYMSILEKELAEPFMKALKSASGFIRRELGRSMKLRYTPELIFVQDNNIEYGIHIAGVLKNILPQEERAEDEV